MEGKYLINDDIIKKHISEWDTILCSISSSKRNGKVTNRKTWVRRENPEKCIKSFLDKHGEKLTNYELGKVNMEGLYLKEDEPNTIRLTEYLTDGTIGVVKFFTPTKVEEVWVYDLAQENNIYLNTHAFENKNLIEGFDKNEKV